MEIPSNNAWVMNGVSEGERSLGASRTLHLVDGLRCAFPLRPLALRVVHPAIGRVTPSNGQLRSGVADFIASTFTAIPVIRMSSFDRWRVAFEDLAGTSAVRQVPSPPGFTTQTLREAVGESVINKE